MAVSWMNALVAAGSAGVGALIVIIMMAVLLRLLGRRWSHARRFADMARLPFRALVVVLATTGWVVGVRDDGSWWDVASLTCRILAIGAGAWLLAAALVFLEDLALVRADTAGPDNRVARRRRTQVLLIKRLTIAAVVVIAVGAVLLSFPGVRALGASLLASAGLISVVAALAAQSTLANVFAGIQLAFNDAIKVDDVVIVEEEWGWIEEITLSYVVVRLWDDRRMVLPSTYFTTTPFQNWTRRTSELLGAVELDLDLARRHRAPAGPARPDHGRGAGCRALGRARLARAGHRRGRGFRAGAGARDGRRRPHAVRPPLPGARAARAVVARARPGRATPPAGGARPDGRGLDTGRRLSP